MVFSFSKKLVLRISISLMALFLSCVINAQAPQAVESLVMQKLLTKHVDPQYPAIAKAAQIQGEVILEVKIDTSGNVTTVKPLSGPPMLQGAAIDAVKQWKYAPFKKDGVPISISTNVTVTFDLGAPIDPQDEKIAQIYFPLAQKCIQAVTGRAQPDEQASACQKAAEEADQFSKESRFIERRSAYVYCTTALIHDKRPKEAAAFGDKAVAVVLQGHDDGSGSSAAYGVRGQARASSGDLVGADKDLDVAEDYQRRALGSPAGQDLKTEYSRVLKSLLIFHSQVLTAMGQQARAQSKTEEAGNL